MTLAALLLAVAVPQGADAATLQRELAALVDLASPKARAIAAERLAGGKLATLEDWLAACAAFGAFEPLDAGIQPPATVDLNVLGTIEPTEIHLYVPTGYAPDRPAPLLLWGHGAGGTGAGQHRAWQAVADQVGMIVLAPTEFGREPGWGSTPRERYAQMAALRWARRRVNVDENAIFVGGVSRGGHMAWDLALRFPDRWAGVLPCVGGPRIRLDQNNMRYLENVAQLPLCDLQGSRDDPALLASLHLVFAELKKLKAADAVLHEFPELGHSYDLSAVDWPAFFAGRRPARPSRLVRMAATDAMWQRRAAWVEITAFARGVNATPVLRVNPTHWDKLDEDGRRALAHKRAVEQTARLEVTDRGKGLFVAKGTGVKSFELLLTAGMLGRDHAVEVKWRSRPVRRTAKPSVAVLLDDFAERFDRTRLPVARVKLP